MASRPIAIWLQSAAGLESVLTLGQTEKSCIVSNYRQFSTNIKIKIIKLSFVS